MPPVVTVTPPVEMKVNLQIKSGADWYALTVAEVRELIRSLQEAITPKPTPRSFDALMQRAREGGAQ